MLEERTLQGGTFSSEISGMTLETRAGNLREAESMPVRSSTMMVIIGYARSALSIESVLRSGSLIPWLGFSSMTRNGNARANFFKKPAHVEKHCFSPKPLSFEMPYH